MSKNEAYALWLNGKLVLEEIETSEGFYYMDQSGNVYLYSDQGYFSS